MPDRHGPPPELSPVRGIAAVSSAHAGVHTLAFSEPGLTALSVAQLERTLREQRDLLPVILDCKALTHVTPLGLAALLELGRSSSGMRELALSQLARPLVLAAIQAGLAERFTIFVSNEACLRSLGREEAVPCEP